MTDSIREAVVIAAGEGRRLRPFTERWPKPILPIDGRPVIATLLRQLAAAGLEHVTVVTGHLRARIEELVRDGSAFGLEIRFAVQPTLNGSADAVERGLEAGAGPPFLVSAADTLYEAGAVAAFAAAFQASGASGAVGIRRGVEPSEHKPGIVVTDGLVERVHVVRRGLPFTSAPLWGLGSELVPYMKDLPGPPFELKDAYQRAIDAGLSVAAVEVGATRDLTFPLDLVRENFPYLRADA